MHLGPFAQFTIQYKKSPHACSIFWSRHVVRHPLLADWNKIGDHRQRQTDLNTACEIRSRHDWDYKVGDKVLLRKDGILRNQKVGMKVILGLSHQFIQMGQSGFNAEQKLIV